MTDSILSCPLVFRTRLEQIAREVYPHEACGTLVGSRSGAYVVVHSLGVSENLERDRARERFRLDPVHLLRAEVDATAAGLEVIGIWHTHPDQPPVPSELDREAAWSGWSWLIVSVSAVGGTAMRSWRLERGLFVEERIELSEENCNASVEDQARIASSRCRNERGK